MNTTARHIDVLKELINVGLSHAVATYDEAATIPIHVRISSVTAVESPVHAFEAMKVSGGPLVGARLRFQGEWPGVGEAVFPLQTALALASCVQGTEDRNNSKYLDALRSGSVFEICSEFISGAVSSINIHQKCLRYDIPQYVEYPRGWSGKAISIGADSVTLTSRGIVRVGHRDYRGSVVIAIDAGEFDRLITAIDERVREQVC